MAKLNKDGKTSNITIRVTEELREKVKNIWEKHYSAIPFNSFLGYLVDQGAKEEEFIAKYRFLRLKEKRMETVGVLTDSALEKAEKNENSDEKREKGA